MKLRVRGNSLRIRVSQAELTSIAQHGAASDQVCFGPGRTLAYGVEVVADGALTASFVDGNITVLLPRAQLERWVAPDQVTVEGEQSLGEAGRLRILVEKDFTCLAPREGEDDGDLFPNPQLAGR